MDDSLNMNYFEKIEDYAIGAINIVYHTLKNLTLKFFENYKVGPWRIINFLIK
jgi:hypothetical protein